MAAAQASGLRHFVQVDFRAGNLIGSGFFSELTGGVTGPGFSSWVRCAAITLSGEATWLEFGVVSLPATMSTMVRSGKICAHIFDRSGEGRAVLNDFPAFSRSRIKATSPLISGQASPKRVAPVSRLISPCLIARTASSTSWLVGFSKKTLPFQMLS